MSLKNNYETVFIISPVLSDVQVKETVEKFKALLVKNDAEIVNEESWGLKKLAYEINHKTTGFYFLLEYKGASTIVNIVETEFRRDEKVIRFLTTVQDKFAAAYALRRRKGQLGNHNKTKEVA
jgi:small subunit ribosomal protein S6